jgi:hypothetical protein
MEMPYPIIINEIATKGKGPGLPAAGNLCILIEKYLEKFETMLI